jgi:hypothetical protein
MGLQHSVSLETARFLGILVVTPTKRWRYQIKHYFGAFYSESKPCSVAQTKNPASHGHKVDWFSILDSLK